MMHAALLLSVALALAAPAKAPLKGSAALAAGDSTFRAFPYPIEQHVLKNGLRVAFVAYDSPGLVAYYTLMRVGSRNEPEEGRSGYAHFFEHMMFRGTKTHSGDDYNATVTRLGLNTNAFTSYDMTVYHLYGPAQALPTIIDYEADRFSHLDYPEELFKTEAGAILGEYAKSASQPDLLFDEKMSGTAFTKHTYRHTVLGFLKDVQAMPQGYAYSRTFFNRYYTPDDATIFVVGDFDHAKALALIEKAYGEWKGKAKPAAVAVEPPQKHARRAHMDWPTQTLPRVWVAWHIPSAGDIKTAAAETLLDGYLFGPTSALHQDLVLGRQLCESIEANWDYLRDPSLFGAIAQVKKVEDIPVVEKAIAEQVKELAAGHIDRMKLEGVRSNLKYRTALSLDTADKAALTLAQMTAITGDVNYFNQLYVQVDKLTAADLAAFAQHWLTEANGSTVTLATASKEVAK